MALSLEAPNAVRQRALAEIRKPKTQAVLKALFSYLAQHKGAPQLQFVSFAALAGTDVVIADAACKVYAIFTKKPAASTVAALFKLTDHATTGSGTAETVKFPMYTNAEDCVVFFDGLAMANGVTLLSHTTSDGTTATSAADRADGFVVVGAP